MINFNGIMLDESKAMLNANNRAFNYGDALFETLKIVNSKIYYLEDHYFRLMASMRMLRMEIPLNFTMEFFESELLNTAEQNNLESARVRLTVFRKDGGLYNPTSNQIDYLIVASPLQILVKEKYSVDIFKDYYLNSDILSTIKTTNKIINVLASIYASENGFDNCILVNERKQVVEAINGNIFMVKGNTIKTPPITEGCIKGITRKKIIEIVSKSDDYSIEETEISPFELQKADEIFITNVIVGIQPITQYKKAAFGTKVSSALALELSKLI
ncbi:MAG: aminotransferase class IV [Bacteroidetes bacterium HGW-Bacteroidetes-3]|jgi:branched-chain amino acid aminotransferase|nr:MAG: aminotransferase class IV [Bacteroidetes bacterium HGW-Bacteroidetes-3]